MIKNQTRKIVITFILIPFFSCSQTNFNQLSKSDFESIMINNVLLSELLNFQGSTNELSQIFDKNFTNTSNDPDNEAKDFENNDLIISYFGYPPNQELSGISILNSSVKISINSVEISLDDNISILGYGNPGFNSFTDQTNLLNKIAVFKPEYEDSYFIFYFLQSSGKITKIEYVSPS